MVNIASTSRQRSVINLLTDVNELVNKPTLPLNSGVKTLMGSIVDSLTASPQAASVIDCVRFDAALGSLRVKERDIRWRVAAGRSTCLG